MATSATGFLTAEPGPDVARRTWPRWLALGVVMIAVAVVSLFWEGSGARLLLGALGLFLVVRGVVLLRGARTGTLEGALAARATRVGGVVLGGGALALVAALVSASAAGWVLLAGVPVLLVATALALLGRGGRSRRGGQALLVWGVLVTELLVVVGLAQDWTRAADVATVVTAMAVAVLGVPMLVAAANLRAVAARPAPTPARPAGCGGCACGAGSCGAG